jgi:hypothetical protein
MFQFANQDTAVVGKLLGRNDACLVNRTVAADWFFPENFKPFFLQLQLGFERFKPAFFLLQLLLLSNQLLFLAGNGLFTLLQCINAAAGYQKGEG